MQEEIVPISYLRRYGSRYPDAWRIAEEIRARRGSANGFPASPDWCYLPTSYVERNIVAEDRSSQTSFSLERIGDPMILAGLCAWRMGKGIYRFDPDLLEEHSSGSRAEPDIQARPSTSAGPMGHLYFSLK